MLTTGAVQNVCPGPAGMRLQVPLRVIISQGPCNDLEEGPFKPRICWSLTCSIVLCSLGCKCLCESDIC